MAREEDGGGGRHSGMLGADHSSRQHNRQSLLYLILRAQAQPMGHSPSQIPRQWNCSQGQKYLQEREGRGRGREGGGEGRGRGGEGGTPLHRARLIYIPFCITPH